MAHLQNKLKWCIDKAKKEGIKHRGLKEIKPDIERSNKHIEKAIHNFEAMKYMIEGNFFDWAVDASFYSMYHCLLAILVKHGYESRNQECTVTAIEYLIDNKKIDLDIKLIKKIATFDENRSHGIITLREEFQYGVETIFSEDKLNELVNETRDFIDIVKDLLNK